MNAVLNAQYLTSTFYLPVAALQSESSINNVPLEDIEHRKSLIEQLRKIPSEALGYLRHFQAQIGCLNRCSFCSQNAGTTLWNMSRKSLANLVAALKTVCLERALKNGEISTYPFNDEHVYSENFKMPQYGLLGTERNDRPGVIYCYLDNDPSAYPYLDDLIQWLYEDIGVRVRIATVGYSRKNPTIQNMHERISNNLIQGIAGLRVSFSPYTYGWTAVAEKAGTATRNDFELDVANLLKTYKNTFLSDKKGRKGACVELRFKPLVINQEVCVDEYKGHLVIKSGSYLIIQKNTQQMEVAYISNSKSHSIKLSIEGSSCYVVRANSTVISKQWQQLAKSVLNGDSVDLLGIKIYEGQLHLLKNEDGEYFALDAERNQSGLIKSKFFYPKIEKRPGAGIIDGERYHLNALLKARTNGQNFSSDHVNLLILNLENQAIQLQNTDIHAADYIRNEVLEVIKSYVRVLKYAEFPSQAYFDRNITIDTGHICNLGRAYSEYKTIASRADLPLTPNHERAFGLTGELAEEGIAWRLAISPDENITQSKNACGKRNISCNEPSILVEKLDLALTSTSTGQSTSRFFIKSQVAEIITLKDSIHFPVIPGHNPKEIK